MYVCYVYFNKDQPNQYLFSAWQSYTAELILYSYHGICFGLPSHSQLNRINETYPFTCYMINIDHLTISYYYLHRHLRMMILRDCYFIVFCMNWLRHLS